MEDPNSGKIDLEGLKKQFSKIIDSLKKIQLKKIDFSKVREIESKKKITYLKIALSSFMIVTILALSVTGYRIHEAKLKAYDVYLGQYKMGTIRDQEEIQLVIENLKRDLSSRYHMDIALHEDISFEETKAKDQMITSVEDLERSFMEKVDFKVYGYMLKVNGLEVGSLKTKEEIEDIIERIKEPYIAMMEGIELKDIRIVEDIEIVKEEMPLYKIGNPEKIYEYLVTSTEVVRTHTVEVGESLWTIAKIYDLTVDDLITANPERNPDKLQIGDEIKLVVPKPVLTVATVAEVEYTEKVKFDTETEYDKNMYKTEKKTKVAGVSGEKLVTANEIKYNGILEEKEIVWEEVVKEPVTEVVVRGTKEPPKTVATGLFLMPTRGTISSRYGMRWGRMHNGLDIAAKMGTPINAADGGTVVFAGTKSTYGKMVEVDHGNGYKTRYAHCSSILVKVGDKVYKGQHIANVGNTGNSTGPHLHFEVLKNGKNQNPANFVK
ncbi:MAG: M23 family metallopeptidase [Tissierellaceae bacterium]|nr:M23 family metallopeptidase [Tissierellaceae bacterium]